MTTLEIGPRRDHVRTISFSSAHEQGSTNMEKAFVQTFLRDIVHPVSIFFQQTLTKEP